jgi:hypothetical protein
MIKNPKKFSKGDIVPFANIPHYHIKHINGDASAFQTICCDDTPGKETFTTLGLSSAGWTAAQIRKKLLNEFNAKPLGIQIVTQKVGNRILELHTVKQLEAIIELKDLQINMTSFLKAEGGKTALSWTPNIQRIAQLIDTPLENIAELYASWQKEKEKVSAQKPLPNSIE